VRIFGLTQKKRISISLLHARYADTKWVEKFPPFSPPSPPSRLAKLKLKKFEEDRVYQGFRRNIGKKA